MLAALSGCVRTRACAYVQARVCAPKLVHSVEHLAEHGRESELPDSQRQPLADVPAARVYWRRTIKAHKMAQRLHEQRILHPPAEELRDGDHAEAEHRLHLFLIELLRGTTDSIPCAEPKHSEAPNERH